MEILNNLRRWFINRELERAITRKKVNLEDIKLFQESRKIVEEAGGINIMQKLLAELKEQGDGNARLEEASGPSRIILVMNPNLYSMTLRWDLKAQETPSASRESSKSITLSSNPYSRNLLISFVSYDVMRGGLNRLRLECPDEVFGGDFYKYPSGQKEKVREFFTQEMSLEDKLRFAMELTQSV